MPVKKGMKGAAMGLERMAVLVLWDDVLWPYHGHCFLVIRAVSCKLHTLARLDPTTFPPGTRVGRGLTRIMRWTARSSGTPQEPAHKAPPHVSGYVGG